MIEPGKSYCMAVDIDAPAKEWLPYAKDGDGRPVTAYEFERNRAELKAKGYVVFPPCDHVGADGRCAGHDAITDSPHVTVGGGL